MITFRDQYNRCKKRYENYRECIQFELSKKTLAKDMSVKHAQLRQEIKKKSKVKIIFLVIHSDIWKLDHVFRKMLEDPYFDPMILVCPYIVYGDEEKIHKDLDKVYHYFDQKGYPVLSSYNSDNESWIKLADLSLDIVFLQIHMI